MERRFYFNLTTGQVEEGKQSSVLRRMGPYATYQEAAEALARAQQRSEDWDAETAAWEEAWDPSEDEDPWNED